MPKKGVEKKCSKQSQTHQALNAKKRETAQAEGGA